MFELAITLGAEASILASSSCSTTIVVPGWAAIAVVGVAAAPRLAQKLLTARQGGSKG